MPGPTLDAHRAAVQSGRTPIEAAVRQAFEAATAPACDKAFIRLFDESARASAAALQAMHRAGAPIGSLAGAPISVKDLYDVAGFPTTAASSTLHDAPIARHDSPAVARVRQAGGVLVGHTNMSEFAFSGVGINPHFGTPVNIGTAALDATPRAPGGSTSGGATSVAAGAALAALGSDTGGSVRIPAALQGLVGFKNTQRLTPLEGTVPLSTTMDTVCAITRDVRDAITLHEVLAHRSVAADPRPLSAWRLAVPRTLMLDALDGTVAGAFDRTLQALRAAGARIEDIVLPELAEVAAITAGGGFSPPESWAWHRRRMAERGAGYDPRVALRIRRGESMSAADYIDLDPRQATLDRSHGRRAVAASTRCCRPPCRSSRRRWRRWWPATMRSSLPTGCCCATPRWSICSMAAHCRCRASATASSPVGLMVWHGRTGRRYRAERLVGRRVGAAQCRSESELTRCAWQ